MTKPPDIVAVQLEPCHANLDSSAWYAYLDGPLSDLVSSAGEKGVQEEIEKRAEETGVPLGVSVDIAYWEEVPTALSKHAGLRRYYVASAE